MQAISTSSNESLASQFVSGALSVDSPTDLHVAGSLLRASSPTEERPKRALAQPARRGRPINRQPTDTLQTSPAQSDTGAPSLTPVEQSPLDNTVQLPSIAAHQSPGEHPQRDTPFESDSISLPVLARDSSPIRLADSQQSQFAIKQNSSSIPEQLSRSPTLGSQDTNKSRESLIIKDSTETKNSLDKFSNLLDLSNYKEHENSKNTKFVQLTTDSDYSTPSAERIIPIEILHSDIIPIEEEIVLSKKRIPSQSLSTDKLELITSDQNTDVLQTENNLIFDSKLEDSEDILETIRKEIEEYSFKTKPGILSSKSSRISSKGSPESGSTSFEKVVPIKLNKYPYTLKHEIPIIQEPPDSIGLIPKKPTIHYDITPKLAFNPKVIFPSENYIERKPDPEEVEDLWEEDSEEDYLHSELPETLQQETQPGAQEDLENIIEVKSVKQIKKKSDKKKTVKKHKRNSQHLDKSEHFTKFDSGRLSIGDLNNKRHNSLKSGTNKKFRHKDQLKEIVDGLENNKKIEKTENNLTDPEENPSRTTRVTFLNIDEDVTDPIEYTSLNQDNNLEFENTEVSTEDHLDTPEIDLSQVDLKIFDKEIVEGDNNEDIKNSIENIKESIDTIENVTLEEDLDTDEVLQDRDSQSSIVSLNLFEDRRNIFSISSLINLDTNSEETVDTSPLASINFVKMDSKEASMSREKTKSSDEQVNIENGDMPQSESRRASHISVSNQLGQQLPDQDDLIQSEKAEEDKENPSTNSDALNDDEFKIGEKSDEVERKDLSEISNEINIDDGSKQEEAKEMEISRPGSSKKITGDKKSFSDTGLPELSSNAKSYGGEDLQYLIENAENDMAGKS